ncbi:GntR family transcriptional regulator [Mycolicibacterium komossense]|uniref:GntR family transcriptional regulator n=1 Tax=Mycolicibacterium komossense TaxID=1779 RepID=A0ABT3C8N9_9MYCO|nr:GntR family transcriptional regulator [Mycolicibacterium komossense]MCV7225815.1 GntR family transcriptional regulator [Mycolicibacterium komossense]
MPAVEGGAPLSGRKLRYQQVYDLVLDIVADRGLSPGDRLPSTMELAEIAEVSAISVRRALDELERAGKIIRHQGIGTFVAKPRIASDPTRPGELLHTLIDDGTIPPLTTSLIGVSVGMPSKTIATALSVEPGQPVWEIWRKRSIDGTDQILERAVLPLSRVPAIDQDRLARGESLYRFLEEQYGFTDVYTEQAFEVDTPSRWETEQLTLSDRDRVVRVRGVSFDGDGSAFDCFEQCYDATKFTFYTAGQTRHRILGPPELSNWSVAPFTSPTAPQGRFDDGPAG